MYENQTSSQNNEFTIMEDSGYIKEQHQEILLGKDVLPGYCGTGIRI